jgi:glycosyltransferase involved in cell wall biosynthesis
VTVTNEMRSAAGPATNDVQFVGNFNPTGVGRHCEQSFFAVLRQRRGGIVPYYVDSTRQISMQQFAGQARNRDGSALLFWRWNIDALRSMPGRKIGWLFFESDRLPPLWLEQMKALDQLWMPSEWARDVLLAHGIAAERLRVVPSGVDGNLFAPAPALAPAAVPPEPASDDPVSAWVKRRKTLDRFAFLMIGKYEKRKSIDEAIDAFLAEFPRSKYPDVAFWIKADHPVFPERAQQLRARHDYDARLHFLGGLLTDEQLATLYNGADAFVYPTKAEGFGLPCIEALACGLPVITTPVSAQQTFLQHVPDLYYAVEYRAAPLEDPDYAHFYGAEYQGTPFGNWALPDMDSLRAGMRDVYENRVEWRERAARASVRIRERFTWDEVGKRAVEVLLGVPSHG